jgi:myo-inositol 2-dehydrogenase/D-chiro-inositol 1-dehydrogenase
MACEPAALALVGAGRMGQVHLDALQRAPGVELVGVVEPLATTRDRVIAAGLVAYATVAELLEATGDRLDGVLIAAPSDQHAELVAMFARARVPMLCEKPVGVRVADVQAAAHVVEQAGVYFQVGYWRRLVPELRRLRERIAAGELGRIHQIACYQWDHELPTEAFRGRSGGIAVDMGVHEFDQTRWLLGQEFVWLAGCAAGTDSAPRALGDPDSAILLARLSGGAAATISLGRSFPHEDSCWLEVWGSEGYERVPFMWDAAGDEVFRGSMVRQVQAFVRGLRGEPVDVARAGDAVAALSVAEWAAATLASGLATKR